MHTTDIATISHDSKASLWRNRDFNIFWSGQTFSTLGDGIALIALPLLVLQATGSVLLMGLVTGVLGATQLVTGFFAGSIVDHVDRRILMICCDVLRMIFYLTIPIGWWLLGPQIWLIFVVVIVCSFLKTLFDVAYVALTATLVAHKQIIKANSRLEATRALAYVVGPALAGLLSGGHGPAFAVSIDSLTFAGSVLSLTCIRIRPHSVNARTRPVGKTIRQEEHKDSHRQSLLTGFRFIWHDPALRAIALLLLFMTLLSSGLIDLVTFYLKHDIGLNDTSVGIMFGLASAGGTVAGITASPLRTKFGAGICWIGAMFLFGVAIVGSILSHNLLWLSTMAVSFTFGRIIVRIVSVSLQQELTPDVLLGRVSGAFWMMNTAPGPLGAAFLTALAGSLGTSAVLQIIGGACILIGIIALFTPIRQLRSQIAGDTSHSEQEGLTIEEDTLNLSRRWQIKPSLSPCQRCGAPMPYEGNFCSNCGYPLHNKGVANQRTPRTK